MVQLFGIAKDKVNETNVPDFKLRRFGVVAAAQYKLLYLWVLHNTVTNAGAPA